MFSDVTSGINGLAPKLLTAYSVWFYFHQSICIIQLDIVRNNCINKNSKFKIIGGNSLLLFHPPCLPLLLRPWYGFIMLPTVLINCLANLTFISNTSDNIMNPYSSLLYKCVHIHILQISGLWGQSSIAILPLSS